jgi:hypothetical protein
MKTYTLFFFWFFVTISATAQYGNNYGGGGMYGNRNGMRGMPNNTKPSEESIEKEKTARLDKLIEKLKTELTLDELQVIAIKNEISASSKKMGILMKSSESDEDKSKEMQNLNESMEKNINSYLNATQKEKYKAFVEKSRKQDGGKL